jgi:hypothetical protein
VSAPQAQGFLLAMEDQFIALHGSRKRRAEKGFPWKADRDRPDELTVVRFKVPQFQRRDGSRAEGPRIVDARKQPWDGAAIGNGSKVIVAFDIYDWDGENGCSMTFQPRAVQVVEFVPYEQVDPKAGFQELEGYSAAGSTIAASGGLGAEANGWALGQSEGQEEESVSSLWALHRLLLLVIAGPVPPRVSTMPAPAGTPQTAEHQEPRKAGAALKLSAQ